MVDGEIVYRDGLFPRFAEGARVIGEAQRIGRSIIESAGLAHRLAPEWRRPSSSLEGAP